MCNYTHRMTTHKTVVIGAGISGLSFAYRVAQSGQPVLVLEQRDQAGGCLHSERRSNGFWYELGAHTTYNSYGNFLEIAEKVGVTTQIIERGPARKSFGFLKNGRYHWLTPPKVLLQLNWIEAALHFPVGIFRDKDSKTIKEYYSALIGRNNFSNVLSPFLAAVPSQSADAFPVSGDGSLFKTRPRREDFPRSYGFRGGLQTVCDGIGKMSGVTIQSNTSVKGVLKKKDHFEIELTSGEKITAQTVAVATSSLHATQILETAFPALSASVGRIKRVQLETMGVVLPAKDVWLPPCAFLVAVDDVFYSAVTRDPFPGDPYRALAFHFKGGVSREDKIKRITEILKITPQDLTDVTENKITLPSPERDHSKRVNEIDHHLKGLRLAVTGNYFAGLAIEDCILRSNSEWQRLNDSTLS